MAFSTFLFIFYFFPVFFIIYYLLPKRYRNIYVLIASYLFYSWASPVGALILLVSSALDYFLGNRIAGTARPSTRRMLLAAGIIMNLGILFYFKYLNFFVGEFSRLLAIFGSSPVSWNNVVFLIGVSFFTFHKIGYLVDVYTRRVERAPGLLEYAGYVAFFPKLMQGPITPYRDIAPQFRERELSLENVFNGLFRFFIGLAKKVLIADAMGNVADKVFALSSGDLTTGFAWLGCVCYTFQIYFDFSGYTDMAIGIARMMGFSIMENFNRPYIAQSFTEFWRRWHISLTGWFREYLYIPLGGNRIANWRTYLNLWIVFLISGLWHGANWTFIVWGIYHGVFLVIDRAFWTEKSKSLSAAIKVPLTFTLVAIGWVIFRSETIGNALFHIGRMFSFADIDSRSLLVDIISNREIFILLLAALLSFFPESLLERLRGMIRGRVGIGPVTVFKMVSSLLLFFLSVISLANSSFKPFIYLRF